MAAMLVRRPRDRASNAVVGSEVVEPEYLAEFGRVGFELVAVMRSEQCERHGHTFTYRYEFPVIRVFAYVKRPR
jgi:hypothetical protein